MKKIAMLVCANSVGSVCTGAACMKAFNECSGAFSQYRAENLELAAFFQCNGCQSEFAQDENLQKKIHRILEIHPDAVHLGVCTLHKDSGLRCETIQKMSHIFLENGISVINGTHSSQRLPDLGRPIHETKEKGEGLL